MFCLMLLWFPTKTDGFFGFTTCEVSCMATVGVGGLVSGKAILSALGFKATGIKAGSWAAKWMASYCGSVAATSIFAKMQSAGASNKINWGLFEEIPKVCSRVCIVLEEVINFVR